MILCAYIIIWFPLSTKKSRKGYIPLICTCLFADLDSEKELLGFGVLPNGLFSPSFSLSSAWGNIKSVFCEFITGKCLVPCKQGWNKEKICCFVDLDLGQMYFCPNVNAFMCSLEGSFACSV